MTDQERLANSLYLNKIKNIEDTIVHVHFQMKKCIRVKVFWKFQTNQSPSEQVFMSPIQMMEKNTKQLQAKWADSYFTSDKY